MPWTDTARPSWDCDLRIIGEDGNVFNLIGIAKKTLKKHLIEEGHAPQEASEVSDMLATYLMKSESYHEVLAKLGDMFHIEYAHYMEREVGHPLYG